MGFLIRMAFWFSLVLLMLPLDPQSENGLSPIKAFFAASEAIGDVAGICERKPHVCETGKEAMHTIGIRAKETARIAYDMVGDEQAAPLAATVETAVETTGSIPLPAPKPAQKPAQ
jgi:hypothetical protein